MRATCTGMPVGSKYEGLLSLSVSGMTNFAVDVSVLSSPVDRSTYNLPLFECKAVAFRWHGKESEFYAPHLGYNA